MSYYFETPELNYTLAEAEVMKKKLIKLLHCDIMLKNVETDEEM